MIPPIPHVITYMHHPRHHTTNDRQHVKTFSLLSSITASILYICEASLSSGQRLGCCSADRSSCVLELTSESGRYGSLPFSLLSVSLVPPSAYPLIFPSFSSYATTERHPHPTPYATLVLDFFFFFIRMAFYLTSFPFPHFFLHGPLASTITRSSASRLSRFFFVLASSILALLSFRSSQLLSRR